MSRVFLAEEPRLARRVVIKVLPPEMGAGVNAERFEREIQLAARLQHPHIVPLLTAGASGDLRYYVMPFIQGESLRVKLAGEGELPVGEAVRVLREVVDALAYAHRNGVVHRDIKPDNVLLSEGHAVVTDFGVAKAIVSGAAGPGGGGAGSLTSLGVALGTPAYMAPEQAVADPHVDHRADIYAVGALAYEMLTGRPPFTGPTPQAMLAAHITQIPDPVIQHRRTISPALSALIMRCLEKRPADRWQSATEMAASLEAMATPTAGFPAEATQPVISSGTELAIRRGHPLRVALWFTAVSVVVLALVYLLVQRLGLPDWVWYGAIVLLLIGLPIMLATSLHERRRALARTRGSAGSLPAGSVARWFTWRKALIGGGLAFAGLTLAAAGYTAMRLLGIGPVGTLVASGILKEREPLLLADFENHSADSTLGPSLTEAFRVDLSQSNTLRLVDPGKVAEALERMQRPAGSALTPALAREVAEREGVKAVVTGQIDPVGRGYVLSASLVGAADGRVLTATRETASDEDGLLQAMDRLSSKLRERIGESLVTIRANPRLEQVTSSSLPALRKYSEAVRLFDEGGTPEEAISLLEEAVALDTGFAMAYRKLAVVLGNVGDQPSRQMAAAARALQHRDRLTQLERELATGYYYSFAEYDPAKAIAGYRSALSIDPNEGTVLNNLASVLSNLRRSTEAESLARRALKTGATPPYYYNLITALVAQGRQAEAKAVLQEFGQKGPQTAFFHFFRGQLDAALADYTGAERAFQDARAAAPGSPAAQRGTSWRLAQVNQTLGRLGATRQELDRLIAVCEQQRTPGCALEGQIARATLDLQYRNRGPEALAAVAAALARHPLASMSQFDRPYSMLTRFYAQAGKPAEAKRFLREYESTTTEGRRRGDFSRPAAYGALAEAEGRNSDALAAYREWYDTDGSCGICGLYETATIYDRAGAVDSAVAYYERVLATPGMERLASDAYARPATYKRLGELYEARNDRRRAAENYTRFVDLWKDADPELQPGVLEVRKRVARLAQESGS
jgi:tetratricopeptide (TPR) repeat protein